MKKECLQKNAKKQPDIQGDTVKKPANQAQVPFLYRPVGDPFERFGKTDFSRKKLYRVIRLK